MCSADKRIKEITDWNEKSETETKIENYKKLE